MWWKIGPRCGRSRDASSWCRSTPTELGASGWSASGGAWSSTPAELEASGWRAASGVSGGVGGWGRRRQRSPLYGGEGGKWFWLGFPVDSLYIYIPVGLRVECTIVRRDFSWWVRDKVRAPSGPDFFFFDLSSSLVKWILACALN
jgi:hypothetical protein